MWTREAVPRVVGTWHCLETWGPVRPPGPLEEKLCMACLERDPRAWRRTLSVDPVAMG